MEVDMQALPQASRFAIMQYVAMLRRMPEGTFEERYNNGDAIVIEGVGTVPFPHANHYVQQGALSTAYNPRAGMQQSPSVLSPAKSNVNRFPTSGANLHQPEKLPSIVPAERRLTIAQMDLLLKDVGASTTDCITTNDYAVRLYQSLDRQFDLSAEISGTVVKLRRPFGVPFQPGTVEHKIRDKIKGKLGATDGSPSSLAEAQKRIVKLQDRVRDMSETIERLRGVKADIEAIQVQVKGIREACAQTKQTTRFQCLDMQDYLSDQIGRFKSIVGVEALRNTGVSTVGTINASRKAMLEEEIRKMKEDNPLRDAASVLRMTLECVAGDMRRIIRAPLDPSKPVADDSDDEDNRSGKGGGKGAKQKGAAPRGFQPNCVQQAIKREIRLPKVELTGGNWEVLKSYDKAGPELDLLNNTRNLLKYLHQMQKLMSQWHVDHSQSTSTINGLKHEIESLTEQLEAAKNAADAPVSKAPSRSTGEKEEKTKPTSVQEPASPKQVAATSKAVGKAGSNAAPKPDGKRAGGTKTLGRKGSNAALKPAAAAEAAAEAEAAVTTPEQSPSLPDAPPPLSHDAPSAAAETSDNAAPVTPPATTPEASGRLADDATDGAAPTNEQETDAPPTLSTSPLPAMSLPASPTVADRPTTAQSSTSDVPSLSKMHNSNDDAMRPFTNTLDSIAGSIHATTSKTPSIDTEHPAASASRPKPRGGGKPPPPQPRGVRLSKASLTSAALADQISSNGSATPRRDDLLSNSAATPPPSQRATPRPAEATSPEPTGATGPILCDDDMVRIQGIFFEIAAAGVPRRLHRLLIELFHLLRPNDPGIAVLREASIDDASERVMQSLSLPLVNAVEHAAPPLDGVGMGAEDEQMRTPTTALARKQTRGMGGQRVSECSPGGAVNSPSKAQEANQPVVADDRQQAPDTTDGHQPPQQGLLKNGQSSTTVRRTASCVMHATTTSPQHSSLHPRALHTTTRAGAASVDENLEPESSASFQHQGRVSALPTTLLGAAGSKGPHPLAQIRQLRGQYTSNGGSPLLPVADALDPSELSEDDALFAKRKVKFVELTRKLLSDLPVMKREHGAHPLLESGVGAVNPPLLFAPARQFPSR